MSDTTLGHLIEPGTPRDAIHIAVAPVIAAHILAPGEHIGFISDEDREHVGRVVERIGIVDPFLTAPVMPNQRFYMVLYQQTVTGMRHEWTHPAFEGYAQPRPGTSSSEAWLREFAEEMGISYRTLLTAAEDYDTHGEYYCLNDDTPDVAYSKAEQFWAHYQALTGKTVSDPTAPFFRCAC